MRFLIALIVLALASVAYAADPPKTAAPTVKATASATACPTGHCPARVIRIAQPVQGALRGVVGRHEVTVSHARTETHMGLGKGRLRGLIARLLGK